MHTSKPSQAPLKRLTLLIELRCNSYCVFCGLREVDEAVVRIRKRHGLSIPDVPFVEKMKGKRYTLETAVAELEEARQQGYDALSLQGGEPSIWPQLPALIERAAELGFREIVMVTNGRRLADPAVAETLVGAGLTGLVVSVLGPDAEIHDGLSLAPGSFSELMRGVANAREAAASRERGAITLNANVITSSRSVDRLEEQVRCLAAAGVQAATVHLVRFDLFGGDQGLVSDLSFPIQRVTPALERAYVAAAELGMALHAEDIAACFQPWLRPDDLGRVFERQAVESHRFALPDFEFAADSSGRLSDPRECDGCLLADGCRRVPPEYLVDGGSQSIRPLTVAGLRAAVAQEAARGEPRRQRLVDWMGALSMMIERDLLPAGGVVELIGELRRGFAAALAAAARRGDGGEALAAFYGMLGLRVPRQLPDEDALALARAPLSAHVSLTGAVRAAELVGVGGRLLVLGPGFAMHLAGEWDGDELEPQRIAPVIPPANVAGGELARALFLHYVARRFARAERVRLRGEQIELMENGAWKIGWTRAAPWTAEWREVPAVTTARSPIEET